MDELTLTVEQMAKELHISRSTAYKLARSEGFPSLTIGTRVLINRKALQDWIDQKTSVCYNQGADLDNSTCG